jgi:hypothetical protein
MSNNLIFKGIQQVKTLPQTPENGVIYFVGNGEKGGNGTKVYFGNRCYGEVNTPELTHLEELISGNSTDIVNLKNIIGEWTESFKNNIGTVASAVIAVSGTATDNSVSINNIITGHTSVEDIHVTKSDKDTWNDTARRLKLFLDESGTSASTLDSIIEFQNWFNEHDSAVESITTAITKNTTDIKHISDNIGTGFTSGQTVASVLNKIKEDLSAITDGAVTEVTSTGKSISVNTVNGVANIELNTLNHETSNQDGYVIFNKTNGGALYGVMYYGGDDTDE